MSQVVIRKFNPDMDSGLIYATWPKGFYYSGLDIKPKDSKKEWFADYYKRVQTTLESSFVPIACMGEDPGTILGYAVINGTTLEWIYVKELFRKQGIASAMLSSHLIDSFNNMTKVGQAILDNRKLKENPDGRTENRQEKQSL